MPLFDFRGRRGANVKILNFSGRNHVEISHVIFVRRVVTMEYGGSGSLLITTEAKSIVFVPSNILQSASQLSKRVILLKSA